MPALAIPAAPFRHPVPTTTAPADRTTTTLADAVTAASSVALALPLDSPRQPCEIAQAQHRRDVPRGVPPR